MTAKVGIAIKRPMAGWDNACLLTVLGILMQLLGPLPQGLTPPDQGATSRHTQWRKVEASTKEGKGIHQWRRMSSKACHRPSAPVTR
jgi:hypothetical protein